jgi:hypothetical protein
MTKEDTNCSLSINIREGVTLRNDSSSGSASVDQSLIKVPVIYTIDKSPKCNGVKHSQDFPSLSGRSFNSEFRRSLKLPPETADSAISWWRHFIINCLPLMSFAILSIIAGHRLSVQIICSREVDLLLLS